MLIESFWNQVQLIWGGKLHTKQKLRTYFLLYRVEPSINIASCSKESNSRAEMHCKEGSVSRGEGRNMPEEVK